MDRSVWLHERRAAVVASYDAEAPTYHDHDYPTEAQHEWVARLLDRCPDRGVVLDAPCGTGRYFPVVAERGLRVVGIDQSAGMLREAEARGLAVALHHLGLQELAFAGEFDAAMTVDAMENVAPEDWPVVLANLRRALRPGGALYLTVEEVTETEIDAAFASLTAAGLPAVRGEVVEGDVASYHYYPDRPKVAGWLAEAGFVLLDEGFSQEDGWGYRHLMLQAATS